MVRLFQLIFFRGPILPIFEEFPILGMWGISTILLNIVTRPHFPQQGCVTHNRNFAVAPTINILLRSPKFLSVFSLAGNHSVPKQLIRSLMCTRDPPVNKCHNLNFDLVMAIIAPEFGGGHPQSICLLPNIIHLKYWGFQF